MAPATLTHLPAMSAQPAASALHLHADAPIGVFDSGIGGLSVLQALRSTLPQEHFVYFADSAHQPYGEKGDAYVAARSHHIAAHLIHTHGIKALVVACNTATTAVIHELRANWPQLPLIGIEPAIKPAVTRTRTGHIGLLATRGTVGSRKLRSLLTQHQGNTHIHLCAADGLAEAIEKRTTRADDRAIADCIDHHLRSLPALGSAPGQIDTLILGCTHYPLVQPLFARWLAQHDAAAVQLLETGLPVARHTHNLLQQHQLLRTATAPAQLQFESSADTASLHAAAAFWHIGT